MNWEIIAMGDRSHQQATAQTRREAFDKAEAFRRDPQGCDFVTIIFAARLVAAWDKPGKKWKMLNINEL